MKKLGEESWAKRHAKLKNAKEQKTVNLNISRNFLEIIWKILFISINNFRDPHYKCDLCVSNIQ